MQSLTHLDSLQKKHHSIQKKIEFAYSHHLSDQEISRLKKEKLRLKDKIQKYAA